MGMNRLSLLLLVANAAYGFEKLDPKYWVSYGNSEGRVQVVEYFSLRCPACLKFFQEEFPSVKERYIDTGAIFWSFHPNPADLLTLQAMVCLGQLGEEMRPLFFEALMHTLTPSTECELGCKLMQTAMEMLQHPVPDLGNIAFLEQTAEFQSAFQFLAQEDVVRAVPTVEVEGTLYPHYPSASLIQSILSTRSSS